MIVHERAAHITMRIWAMWVVPQESALVPYQRGRGLFCCLKTERGERHGQTMAMAADSRNGGRQKERRRNSRSRGDVSVARQKLTHTMIKERFP